MVSEKQRLRINITTTATTDDNTPSEPTSATTKSMMHDLEHLHPASPRRLNRRIGHLVGALALLAILSLAWIGFDARSAPLSLKHLPSAFHYPHPKTPKPTPAPKYTKPRRRVPLEAHIMSKCPDAKDCLHDLILPAMQRIESLVDFKLSFIGSYGQAFPYGRFHSLTRSPSVSPHDDGLTCKHGPPECLGNMLELCAASLYPSPKTYLGFAMCLSRDYGSIPQRELVEDCALEHGIAFGELNKCVSSDDGFGVSLLRKSMLRSESANVTKSCTVRLDDEIRCIRDGGKWSDCPGGKTVDDLVSDVERLAAGG